MDNKMYFYDNYYSLKQIREKYQKLAIEQKKQFRDTLAHFTLVEILKKCNYDERIIDSVLELAKIEVALLNLYDSDCGRVLLVFQGQYKRDLRKLINLSGRLASRDDKMINKFINGEFFVNNLVFHTLGSSFAKIIEDDLFLIDYNSLSEEECLAISDNFIKDLKGEEITFYQPQKRKNKA